MMWAPTRGTALGRIIYAATKMWIVALPVVWRLWVERQPISLSPMRRGGLGPGASLGVMIAFAIAGGYWFIGRHVIDPAILRDAAALNGINHPLTFLGWTIVLTLVNSLLEEFVWRWFVYRQCERLLPGWPAVIASAAFFTLHHVILLRALLRWMPALLASCGIFICGAAWSWLYRRYNSIWPGYLSHVLADAAVFAVGWRLLFG
jgi:hypothetical protein